MLPATEDTAGGAAQQGRTTGSSRAASTGGLLLTLKISGVPAAGAEHTGGAAVTRTGDVSAPAEATQAAEAAPESPGLERAARRRQAGTKGRLAATTTAAGNGAGVGVEQPALRRSTRKRKPSHLLDDYDVEVDLAGSENNDGASESEGTTTTTTSTSSGSTSSKKSELKRPPEKRARRDKSSSKSVQPPPAEAKKAQEDKAGDEQDSDGDIVMPTLEPQPQPPQPQKHRQRQPKPKQQQQQQHKKQTATKQTKKKPKKGEQEPAEEDDDDDVKFPVLPPPAAQPEKPSKPAKPTKPTKLSKPPAGASTPAQKRQDGGDEQQEKEGEADEEGEDEEGLKEEEEDEGAAALVDTTRPFVVSQWLQVVCFGDCAGCQQEGGGGDALVSRVCDGTVWPVGWESHRVFENPRCVFGRGQCRTHVCRVGRDRAGRVVFSILVDGELVEGATPAELMGRFCRRFVGHERLLACPLQRAWLQSCEHFFGLVAVAASVRAMPGHAAALSALQRKRTNEQQQQQRQQRQQQCRPLLAAKDVFVPATPWCGRRRRRRPATTSSAAAAAGEGSSGSDTESGTEALFSDAQRARAYARMSEHEARAVLGERDEQVARLRELVRRGEAVLHGLCSANNQWLLLQHIRLARTLEVQQQHQQQQHQQQQEQEQEAAASTRVHPPAQQQQAQNHT